MLRCQTLFSFHWPCRVHRRAWGSQLPDNSHCGLQVIKDRSALRAEGEARGKDSEEVVLAQPLHHARAPELLSVGLVLPLSSTGHLQDLFPFSLLGNAQRERPPNLLWFPGRRSHAPCTIPGLWAMTLAGGPLQPKHRV